MQDSAQEKRQFPRIRGYFPLTYKLCSGHKNHSTLTRDLSVRGMRIITFESLPVKEELRLEITLGTNIISAKGKVVWTQSSSHGDRFYSGVKFDEIPHETETAIKKYISI